MPTGSNPAPSTSHPAATRPATALVVVTGGPGSGKSTLIAALANAGLATRPEAGRRVIRDETATGGRALPWIDPDAFALRMLALDRAAHREARRAGGIHLFDRGILDILGYLRLAGRPVPPVLAAAARVRRYHPTVLAAPPWPDIYRTDGERRQSPEEAERTFHAVCAAWRDHGYSIQPLPRAAVADRVGFVLEFLARRSR